MTPKETLQGKVAAAMVAASTPFSYTSVQQFDGNRSIICSSCSGSSSCGRNAVHHHHHLHPPHPHPHPQHLHAHQQQQQQQQRGCTRCQSFHRHHHRQRRRSSMFREDFTSLPNSYHSGGSEYGADNADNAACSDAGRNGSSNSNGNGRNVHITKAIVTFSSPVAAESMNAASSMSGSMLTISSVPTTLMLGATATPAGRHSLSAATTPLAVANSTSVSPANVKHCSFALTPLIPPPPPPRQLSFLTTAPFHVNSPRGVVSTAETATVATSLSATAHTHTTLCVPAATLSAPSLIEAAADNCTTTSHSPLTPLTPSSHTPAQESDKHATLEAHRSATSQFATLEDVDKIVVDETHNDEMRKLA
ncbi:unnamed protein product [Ceratitis capitata]|uniref:(Mediterranean fruit fly) hypothetical protein n=1 Tax=Ceratitis capitata TaxID=7213 RepID=A0A811U8P3_CERCA|nr:unnamed protein product [Ceratitis capitata]